MFHYHDKEHNYYLKFVKYRLTPFILLITKSNTVMKRKLILSMFAALAFSLSVSAQKSITTVHFYDVKNAAMEKTYIASLKEINAIMSEIGYPNNYYSYMKISPSDTTSTFKNCTIGHWTSEEAYKLIHEHPKFKAWGTKNKDNNAVFITGQLYRRFYNED